ncbi:MULTISPECIES: DUF5799 family protein [unclassified Haladaptatus]|uniref:DUF5799 family protein n=1 Tax=unclassified Haladaptatus TaxID=2622732 RepID=UPI0023E7C365|nr:MULTISPECIES: DUF5799 family protein [unclassified Haladaptatus]
MSERPWRDRIVGARMTVDNLFADRIAEAQLTRQEWGLIMMAVELEIEHPEDPDQARLVANTEKLPDIVPELDNIRQQMEGGMGGPPQKKQSGGMMKSVKSALGLGSNEPDVDEAEIRNAERLAQEYADMLQKHLQENGRWDDVRRVAAEQD